MSTGCVIWTGAFDRHGRARLGTRIATLVLWEQERGPIGGGRVLHHVCRNKACVNLDHLRVMTVGEHHRLHNAERLPVTHCVKGHAFTEENTRIYRGQQVCRQCDRERRRAERVQRKESGR